MWGIFRKYIGFLLPIIISPMFLGCIIGMNMTELTQDVYGGVEADACILTSAQDGGEGSASRSDLFTPGERVV
jgi:hypothetical protein